MMCAVTVALMLIVAVVILYLIFRPININGDSMYPTFKEGEVYLTVRLFKKSFKEGNIYVFHPPYDPKRYVIKRLTRITPQGLFFEGDNKPYSYDSRDYGYVSEDKVKYRVITKKGVERCERDEAD